jgi:hypothetical protein
MYRNRTPLLSVDHVKELRSGWLDALAPLRSGGLKRSGRPQVLD